MKVAKFGQVLPFPNGWDISIIEENISKKNFHSFFFECVDFMKRKISNAQVGVFFNLMKKSLKKIYENTCLKVFLQ